MTTTRPLAVKSADRALDVIEHLAAHPEGRTHAELATALGIPKGSLTPLLRTLAARGWVAAEDGRHVLGQAARALARPETDRLLALAPAVLRRLTAATEESSSLNLRRSEEVEVVACANSELPLLYSMRVGDRAPLYAVSGGKIILAMLPEAVQETYLATARFRAITPRTLSSPAALRQELKAARAEGIAYSFEEFTPGIIGMGAAIPGRPDASVNVAIPAVRFGPEKRARCANALREAARTLAA